MPCLIVKTVRGPHTFPTQKRTSKKIFFFPEFSIIRLKNSIGDTIHTLKPHWRKSSDFITPADSAEAPSEFQVHRTVAVRRCRDLQTFESSVGAWKHQSSMSLEDIFETLSVKVTVVVTMCKISVLSEDGVGAPAETAVTRAERVPTF